MVYKQDRLREIREITEKSEEPLKSLNPGGALYLVIRKQQGAESCMKYLKTLFDSVEKLDKSGGFWILKASGPKA